MMKPHTYSNEFYVTKTWKEEPAQENIMTWFLVCCLLGSILACATVTPGDDFTDSGVGCVDDCLEPGIQDEADTFVSMGRIES